MKDKKTKVIDATKAWSCFLDWKRNMNTKGAKNTIMNMILTFGCLSTSCHEDVESIRDQLVAAYPDKKKTFEKECPGLFEEITGFGSSISGWIERRRRNYNLTPKAGSLPGLLVSNLSCDLLLISQAPGSHPGQTTWRIVLQGFHPLSYP